MTPSQHPHIVVLGGPNGAGKTTASAHVLRDTLAVEEFVNADVIATGLSGFAPERSALAAGRLMLRRLAELARSRADFAFETTLASKSFAPWLRERMQIDGYAFHLLFLWLPSADLAVERVADRVRRGGHWVPTDVVRRRYARGIANFRTLYRPLATTWQCFDSSQEKSVLVARGGLGRAEEVLESGRWSSLLRTGDGETKQT